MSAVKRAIMREAARMIAEDEQRFTCCAVDKAAPKYRNVLDKEYVHVYTDDGAAVFQHEIQKAAIPQERQHLRVMLLLMAAEVL